MRGAAGVRRMHADQLCSYEKKCFNDRSWFPWIARSQRWKAEGRCGKMGFSLIHICSRSPRQRVVRGATCCMTMMLWKFKEAFRAFLQRLAASPAGQRRGQSASNTSCVEADDQLKESVRFDFTLGSEPRFHQRHQEVRFEFVSPRSINADDTNYSIRLKASAARMMKMLKCEGGKWPHFDVKALESHMFVSKLSISSSLRRAIMSKWAWLTSWQRTWLRQLLPRWPPCFYTWININPIRSRFVTQEIINK